MPLEEALLWLGAEDYTGLWEALWEVRGRLPQLPVAEARARTADAFFALHERGFVRLCLCHEPLGNDPLELIEATDVQATLDRDRSWKPPGREGVESIRYFTTDSGAHALGLAPPSQHRTR